MAYMTTNPVSQPIIAALLAQHDNAEVIPSRFGEIAVDLAQQVTFPRGLLGLPNRARFVLAEFPGERMRQFRLLQSLDEQALSFITLPLALDNPVILKEDIRVAARELGILEEELAVLLIVSVQRVPSQIRITVNARAPLFIDASRKLGAQYVFPHDRYKVQHALQL